MSERRIRTAGLLIDAIVVSTNTLAQCGGITNGVSVDDSSGTLCGVLDWEDLKTAVQEIARNRGETLGHDRAAGAAQERAAIVALLEKEAKANPYRHATYGDSCTCCVREQTLEDFAEAIRAGAHETGGGE